MKPSGKEILIIFVLAVSATSLSWFIKREITQLVPGTYPTLEMKTSYVPFHGFPLPFWRPEPYWAGNDRFIPLGMAIIDILFYLVIIFLVWIMLKSIFKKFKR